MADIGVDRFPCTPLWDFLRPRKTVKPLNREVVFFFDLKIVIKAVSVPRIKKRFLCRSVFAVFRIAASVSQKSHGADSLTLCCPYFAFSPPRCNAYRGVPSDIVSSRLPSRWKVRRPDLQYANLYIVCIGKKRSGLFLSGSPLIFSYCS